MNVLIKKLDEFIRRYYKNRLLEGALYTVGLLVGFFLIVNVFEYFGNFGIVIRTILFWLYLLAAFAVIWYYVLIPIFKIYKFGKIISYEEAARIIGKHFPEVSDKLLNAIQLQNLSNESDSELLKASIQQKTNQLSPVPFVKAIDYSKNKKYLKYAVIPLAVLLGLLITLPSFITGPSKRILQHSTYFEKPAPFQFIIQNDTLQVAQQEDFTIKVKTQGDELPDQVFVEIGGVSYKMSKSNKQEFNYELKNVQKSVTFRFSAVEIFSPDYLLEALPKPILIDFQAQITYPSYTGKKPETFSNTGDLVVPKGSSIQWKFQTRDTKTFSFIYNDKTENIEPDANGRLAISKRVMENVQYGFFTTNQYISAHDSLKYSVTSIEDAYPQIIVFEQRDSLIPNRVFFKGQIKDDYGFSKLQFKINKTNSEDTSVHDLTASNLNIDLSKDAQEFYHYFDLANLQIMPGDRVEYYFQVWDNDGINGAKSTVSKTFVIEIPGLKQIDEANEKTSKQIQEQAIQSMSEIKKIQKEINELMKKLVDKKELNWQDKKQLEELAKKEQQLKQSIQEIQQKVQQNNLLEQQYKDLDPAIVEKQKQLEKLFNELMNNDLKDLFNELDKLMRQVDKDKIKESLDNIKMNNENIEKQLDRDIELMKRLDVEKRLEDAIQQTQKLAEKQRQLSEESKKNNNSSEDAQKKQEQLNQEFQDLKKQLDDIQKKNSELESPQDFKRNENLEKNIQQSQQSASDQLKQKKQKEAAKKQEEAAEKMEEMSQELSDMKDQMEDEQLAEDADQTRQLLKNLLKISFEQERLMERLKGVYVQDPVYQEIIKGQSKLKDDFKMVEDSLAALGKRQIQINSIVNKELSIINSRMDRTMESLLMLNQVTYGRNQNTGAQTHQQYVMTSINNLSLILAESLSKMQQNMRSNSQKKKSSSRSGNASCDNPSNGKPKPKSKPKPDAKSMRQLQEQLNKQLEQLKGEIEKQNKEGKKSRKIGEGNQQSEEVARMAAQQEQIRRMMQEYSNKLKQESGGKANGNLDNLMRDMEQTETDIINKTITQQTLMRQQQILTKLLEHERAQQKQEQEEKRESREGKDTFFGNQNPFLEYNKLKGAEQEMIRTTPPSFTFFYKQKVNEYFYKFEESK